MLLVISFSAQALQPEDAAIRGHARMAMIHVAMSDADQLGARSLYALCCHRGFDAPDASAEAAAAWPLSRSCSSFIPVRKAIIYEAYATSSQGDSRWFRPRAQGVALGEKVAAARPRRSLRLMALSVPDTYRPVTTPGSLDTYDSANHLLNMPKLNLGYLTSADQFRPGPSAAIVQHAIYSRDYNDTNIPEEAS